MSRNKRPVIVWFRQDLRLHDQAALHAAASSGHAVVPLYILDEEGAGRWRMGAASRWWLDGSLRALRTDLERLGSQLVLRRGDTVSCLAALAAETGAAAVHAGIAVEPWARALSESAGAALAAAGVGIHWHDTVSLFPPESIRTQAGKPFGVYSPFARACFGRGGPPRPLPPPPRIAPAPRSASDDLDDWTLLPKHLDWAGGLRESWEPGEAGARKQLARFAAGALATYDATRNLPGTDGTSRLSPHLHFGEISPGQVWHVANHAGEDAGKPLEDFLKEVLWREFSIHLLWHHPTLPDAPLRAEFASMPWRRDAAALRAWQRGRTGVPIIDAGMRQLWHTGWLHNRVRMLVASFFVKHLLLPWQAGEAWFWDTLVDADLASNSASWQWVAGSGADAAPYFRVFNPVLQGWKFDANGAYVRRWVPEIAGLPDELIHAPWQAPRAALEAASIELGKTYPLPLVDLQEARDRALAAYRSLGRGPVV